VRRSVRIRGISMISVLIVDDEYLIRSLIRNSIPWEKYGLEVIGEAGDGEEALSFIEIHRPQIALVDINMPICNGLELAQKVQERRFPTRIIFLTGYREFEYAKQAVAYQAFDYLLKPISIQEMVSTLTRLRQEIDAEQESFAHIQRIERQSSKGKQLLRERFLHQLAFGRVHKTSSQLSAEFQRLEIDLMPDGLLAMVVEIEVNGPEWDDGLYVYAVMNILCELLRENGAFQHINEIFEVDTCAVVLCNAVDEAYWEAAMRTVWDHLIKIMEQHFPFSIVGGVSSIFQGYEKISAAVKSAMEALGGRFYQTEQQLFFVGLPAAGSGSLASTFSSVNLEELQTCVDVGNREEGEQLIRGIFQRMRQEQVQEIYYRMAALGLLAILYSLSAKYKISPEKIQTEETSISERICKSGTCYEIEELLLDCYNRFMDTLQMSRKVSKLVLAAQDYIKENYQLSDLSLKKTAAAVFAAPAYVSSLFKREIGVSMTEYITICRMKKAVELLKQERDISLVTVSEQVGYTDPYYFSRCFKKYYGVSPSKLLANRTSRENT
jgi:two-component system response regulator YesN